MEMTSRTEIRRSVLGRRHAPKEPTRLVATFDSGRKVSAETPRETRATGRNACDSPHGLADLLIEPTDAEGNLADWFNDRWWTDVIQHWGDQMITVMIAPCPAALPHPVVLYHMEMIRRVVPRWRTVGHAYVDDLSTDDDLAMIAGSPYHEVRFLSQRRPGVPPADRCDWNLPIEQLISRIRGHQYRIGRVAPVMVRLPAVAASRSTRPAAASKREASAS